MKAKSINILLLSIVAAFCLATQCEKEPPFEGLPPETQEGKNTFGCLVNDILFIKLGTLGPLFGPKGLSAKYGRDTKKLDIYASTDVAEFSFMELSIDNPQSGETTSLSVGYLTGNGGRECYGFACKNCGQVSISKMDTTNRIVSGTFNFFGNCADLYGTPHGDSTVQITDGRFDIKLDIY